MDYRVSQFSEMNDIIRRPFIVNIWRYKICNFCFIKPHYCLDLRRGLGERKMRKDWNLTNEISYIVSDFSGSSHIMIGVISSQLGKQHYGRYQKIQATMGRQPTENREAFMRAQFIIIRKEREILEERN